MCGNTVGCHTLMQSATGVQWVAERVDATFVKMERKGHTHPHTGTHTHTKKQNRNGPIINLMKQQVIKDQLL